MQWMFPSSTEAPGVAGLGVFPGECVHFPADVKSPHVAGISFSLWANPTAARPSQQAKPSFTLLILIAFLLSRKQWRPANTVGCSRPLLRRDRLSGVQFHPEKSGPIGVKLLRNFCELEMLTKRIIACLDVDGGRVVKGVQFLNLRDAGDPAELHLLHSKAGADEIITIGHFSHCGKAENSARHGAANSARAIHPVHCWRWCAHIGRCLVCVRCRRRDKVSINSAALSDPGRDHLHCRTIRFAGSDCGHRREAEQRRAYEAFRSEAAERPPDEDAVVWAREAESRGAGEILLTSMDRDGRARGFDHELTSCHPPMSSGSR